MNISIPTHQHPFDLVVSQTALLVIDMQIDFCDRTGFCGANLQADVSLIPQLQHVIQWARRHGIWIIYTRESHKPDFSDLPASKKQRYINAGYPIGSMGNHGRFLVRGEAGTEILPELAPMTADWQLDKPAQSAFVGTELELGLRDRGITHLLVTGVTTPCCVLGTYRQAGDLGFYPLLLADCCAALDPAEHAAAIAVLLAEQGAIGWVSSAAILINSIP